MTETFTRDLIRYMLSPTRFLCVPAVATGLILVQGAGCGSAELGAEPVGSTGEAIVAGSVVVNEC